MRLIQPPVQSPTSTALTLQLQPPPATSHMSGPSSDAGGDARATAGWSAAASGDTSAGAGSGDAGPTPTWSPDDGALSRDLGAGDSRRHADDDADGSAATSAPGPAPTAAGGRGGRQRAHHRHGHGGAGDEHGEGGADVVGHPLNVPMTTLSIPLSMHGSWIFSRSAGSSQWMVRACAAPRHHKRGLRVNVHMRACAPAHTCCDAVAGRASPGGVLVGRRLAAQRWGGSTCHAAPRSTGITP